MSGITEVEDAARHVAPDARARAIVAALGGRSIVLVGLMGSGKTAIGRRLAHRLGLEFVDSDAEIEWAAGMTIPEIFAHYGEPYFRDGERRVMARLLAEGTRVIATGGGDPCQNRRIRGLDVAQGRFGGIVAAGAQENAPAASAKQQSGGDSEETHGRALSHIRKG
jgi:hypothetical protein